MLETNAYTYHGRGLHRCLDAPLTDDTAEVSYQEITACDATSTLITCYEETNAATNTVTGCATVCANTPNCVGFAFGVAGRENDCCVHDGKHCDSNSNWDYYEMTTGV